MLERQTSTITGFKIVETSPKSPTITLAEPDYRVAVPYQEYYGTRLFRFIADFQLALVLAAVLYAIYFSVQSCSEYVIMPIACCLMVPVKLVRGLNWFDKCHDSMIVIDSSGARLTFVDAFWRALVLCFTIPLLPINLFFMVTGSRSLLHDILSGTVVRPACEDPLTTFYPPPQRGWAIALVVACLLLVCYSWQLQSYLCMVENVVAPVLFGANSPVLYRYWMFRDSFLVRPTDGRKAEARLVISEDRCRLSRSCFGEKSIETAIAYLFAARMSALAEDKSKCVFWIRSLQKMPQDLVGKAIGYDLEEYETIVRTPQEEYGYLLDLVTRARRPLGSYSIEPIFDERKKEAEKLKMEILEPGPSQNPVI